MGLEVDKWIEVNPWIKEICSNPEEEKELYYAIQAEDWRHGSCGGCI